MHRMYHDQLFKALKFELQIIEDQKSEELKSLKLYLKTLQQKVWDQKTKSIFDIFCTDYNAKICFIDPLLRDSLSSMQHLIGLKADAIK